MNAPATAPAQPEIDRQTRRGLVALAAQTSNLLVIIDEQTLAVRYLNNTARSLLGFGENEAVSHLAWTDLIAKDAIARFICEIFPAALREGVWRDEISLCNRDGSEHLVRMVVMSLPPENGSGGLLAISASDITGARDAETRYEHEQTLLRALLQTVPDAIYFKDLSSRIIRCSEWQARKKGFEAAAEMEGMTDFDVFSSEHAQQAYDDEQRIIRTGQPLINIEEKETWQDGRVTWVSTSKMPLKDRDGHTIGTFGISRDITARKVTEQRLQIAQKELVEASRLAGMAEIASGVLHNIGNALNTVNTSVAIVSDQMARSRVGNLSKVAQMLEAHKDDIGGFITQDPKGSQLPAYIIQLSSTLAAEREAVGRELAQLQRGIEHIKEVVAMQQNYARVSRLIEDVDPATLINEALYISEMSLNRHGVTVHREIQDVPKVRVTRHKVLQILVNLIRNAKYALDETGRPDKSMVIALGVTPEGRVRVTVRDNGVGIPQENLTRIFNFGFTTRKQGHGFGLHSSANAAKELGGSLNGESEGPGKGATFTLELPAAPAGPIPAEDDKSSEARRAI